MAFYGGFFMYQIAYISYASEVFDPEADDGIDDILKSAKSHNKDLGITGMLLFKGGVFLQILEGEKEAIEKLYGKIALDLRHEGLKLLVKQEASERIFQDWTMGFKLINEVDLDLINTILPWKSIIEDTKNRKRISKDKILQIFKEFRYQMGKEK